MRKTDMIPTIDLRSEPQDNMTHSNPTRLPMPKTTRFPFSQASSDSTNGGKDGSGQPRCDIQIRSETNTFLTVKVQSPDTVNLTDHPLVSRNINDAHDVTNKTGTAGNNSNLETNEISCLRRKNDSTDSDQSKKLRLWNTSSRNEKSPDVPCITVQVENGDPVPLDCTDPIDLYNACRAFYQSRLESTRRWQERWRESELFEEECSLKPTRRRRFRSPIEKAMATLKKEMACLMEQDLCLMKQLLTMNEEIEELKWRRRQHQCGWGSTSSCCSSEMVHSASSLTTVGEHEFGSLPSSPESTSISQLDANLSPPNLDGERHTEGQFGNLLSVQSTVSKNNNFRSRASSDSATTMSRPLKF